MLLILIILLTRSSFHKKVFFSTINNEADLLMTSPFPSFLLDSPPNQKRKQTKQNWRHHNKFVKSMKKNLVFVCCIGYFVIINPFFGNWWL